MCVEVLTRQHIMAVVGVGTRHQQFVQQPAQKRTTIVCKLQRRERTTAGNTNNEKLCYRKQIARQLRTQYVEASIVTP